MADASMIKTFLTSLPPGENPFRFGVHLLEEKRYPPVSKSTFSILIGFGVVHLCIVWVCCAVIVVPLLYSTTKRHKYLWLMKSVYAAKGQAPFRVPNSVLAVAASQLISSAICLVYTYLDYAAFRSPRAASNINLYAWVQLMWLFGFFGYWITGWSGLCTTLCSPLTRIPRLLRPLVSRPHLVNLFSLLFPTIVCAETMAWIVFLVLAYQKESRAYFELHEMLSLAADQYEAKEVVDFKRIYQSSVEFVHVNRKLTGQLRWNSFFWAVVDLFTLSFIMLSGSCLIDLLRRSTAKVKDLKSLETRVRLSGDQRTVDFRPAQILLGLRKGYIYVLCHLSAMMASILCTIIICLVIGVKANLVVLDSRWRALGSWLYLVSGVIVSFTLVLQSWRILSDLDIIITESEPDATGAEDLEESWPCEGDAYGMDNLTIRTGKEVPSAPEVQIQQAVVGVRLQKPRLLVIRRAF